MATRPSTEATDSHPDAAPQASRRPLLRDLTQAELSARANELRHMADAATTQQVRDSLLRLSRRFAQLAASRKPAG